MGYDYDRTAAVTKSVEILDLNEDLNEIVKSLKKGRRWSDKGIRATSGKQRESNDPNVHKVSSALSRVGKALDASTEASRALNDAAQHYEK